MSAQERQMSCKKKFIKKGVFHAELNDFLRVELEQDVSDAGYSIGYAGLDIRHIHSQLELVIRATKTTQVVGAKGRRIRELTKLIERRFGLDPDNIKLFAERIPQPSLCALAQAEAVKFKLMEGIAVRRACYRALRFITEGGAKGCEIVVSGKLRGQRAKAMKFKKGYMITAGESTKKYIDSAVKHVKLRQGVLGIKVKIMLPHDPNGQAGPSQPMPDYVEVKEPKTYNYDEPVLGYAQQVDVQEDAQVAAAGQDVYDQGAQMVDNQQGYGMPAEQGYGMDQQMGQPAAMPEAAQQPAYEYGVQPPEAMGQPAHQGYQDFNQGYGQMPQDGQTGATPGYFGQ